MENLSISDSGPRGAGPPQQQQQQLGPQMAGPQQLPPQMFTTAAQLLDLTDTNLVLQATIERIFVPPPNPSTPGLYADIPRGTFLVRGENVLLLGEIDLDRDDEPPAGYELADSARVEKLAKERREAESARGKVRIERLNAIGFEGENVGDVLL
ncbi:related to LSM1 protein [Cephalotrichum gorgonifer]|uniref:Related to LSM1 protein n=1 Tax=Cephalotrichum gorgonifer TaxID=2041049 RepID=A0AAE8MSX0_9PEZI|nr:related to LSM1 protein [Cephalotrichum gorgonifer]